jgi:hypothetical protein
VSLRSEWRYLAVLIGLAAALWVPRLRGPLDLRYDGGVYYILGTSLAEGRGYRILSEPGAIEAVQYPPLLPALAALHMRLLGTGDPAVVGPWLRLTLCAMFLAYIAAVFLMSRRYLPAGSAFLVGLVTLLHMQTIFLSDFFTADVPYALATVLFFLAAPARRETAEGTQTSWAREVACGTLAVAAYALRTAGIALLVAWIADSLLARRIRQTAIRAAVALAAVASWQAYTTQVKSSSEYQRPSYAYQRADYQFYNVGYFENMQYVDPFRPELGRISRADFARRIGNNVRLIPLSIGEAVSEHKGWWRGQLGKWNLKAPALALPEWLADAALVALSLPVAAGFILLAIRGYRLIVLYTAGSVLLIALTPWPVQFSRYLIPLTPFLALGLMYLITDLAGRSAGASSRRRRWASMAFAALLGFIVLQQTYTVYTSYTRHHEPAVYTDAAGRRHDYRLFFYDRTWRLHDDAIDWLAGRAKAGEVVATSTPHWVYLKTGLPAVMPPYEADPQEAERLLNAVPVTYLIVDNLSFLDVGRRYTLPVIKGWPERWSLIYFANDTGPRIYRRVGPAGLTASKAASSRAK